MRAWYFVPAAGLAAFLAPFVARSPVTLAAPAEVPACKVHPQTSKVSDFAANPELADIPLDLAKWGIGDCFADEVLVLDGDQRQGGLPLVECKRIEGQSPERQRAKDCTVGKNTNPANDVEAAADRALDVLAKKRVRIPARGWDEAVVFGLDFAKMDPMRGSPVDGPLFFRAFVDGKPLMHVANIGRVAKKGDPIAKERPDELPFFGYISAGATHQIPPTPLTGTLSVCDRPDGWANCSPELYAYFDALAQASAGLYGPYLETDPLWMGKDTKDPAINTRNEMTGWGLSSWHGMRSSLVDAAGNGKLPANQPRVWNALLDMDGSILGGNTWRHIGNSIYEVGRPRPLLGVSGARSGRASLRFHPLDLYLLGFITGDELEDLVPAIPSFLKLPVANVFRPAGATSLTDPFTVAPTMGTITSGVALLGTAGDNDAMEKQSDKRIPQLIPVADIIAYNGGERTPSANRAPHHLRQLWIALTRPRRSLEDQYARALASDKIAKEADPAKKAALEKTARLDILKEVWANLTKVQVARRQWNQAFYLQTGYRGRMVTAFEADTDDEAIFEFGSPVDDKATFELGGGLQAEFSAVRPDADGGKVTAVRVDTPGAGGFLRYKGFPNREAGGKPLALRIAGAQTGRAAPNNTVALRMRLSGTSDQAVALVSFDGMPCTIADWKAAARPCVRIPGAEPAHLLADGRWHDYSANLSHVPAFTAGTWKDLVIVPSTEAATLEIDYVRVGYAEKATDGDRDCAGQAKPDGWVDAEDNCPTIFNPAQEDGNGDGVGDACEDADTDGVGNLCDNCPRVSNSRQRDSDKDGIGDVCDEAQEGCALSVGGPGPAGSSVVGWGLAAFGLVGLLRGLRRRR
jgi:MYXO-CTERM domain-containing protein